MTEAIHPDLMADARHIRNVWRNLDMIDQAPTTRNTAEAPMTDAQRAVLAVVQHPTHMKAIERATGLSKSTVANAVTSLITRGYASDEIALDGCIRVRIVTITEEGLEALT